MEFAYLSLVRRSLEGQEHPSQPRCAGVIHCSQLTVCKYPTLANKDESSPCSDDRLMGGGRYKICKKPGS
jgi:hypothetical protein